MKERLKNLKQSRKGGFTLVELIVVLIILAILAALLIPSLTGYIDKAKERGIVAETRSCVMAAQTLADIDYGNATATSGTVTSSADGGFKELTLAEIKNLAEVEGDVTSVTVTDGKITALTYTHGSDTCNYNEAGTSAGKFTIS